MNIPTVKPASSYNVLAGNIDTVIDLGSSVELTFDKAVKIVLGGKAGKKAAWARGTNTLTEITTICNSATNPTNINTVNPKECYINSESDLIIRTYHFTTFASYSPSSTTTAATGGGSGSGSGLGCLTKYKCSEWSDCVNGIQTRTCSKEKEFCNVYEGKPAETQECTINETATKGFFSAITGAIIGALGTGGSIIVGIFIVGIIGASVTIMIRKKNAINKKK